MPAYHTVPLAQRAHTAPAQPSIGVLRPWEPVEWWPARNVMVAQDTLVPCARRPLISFGLEGFDTWPFGDSPAAATDVADKDAWRVVYPPTTVRLTPGNYLRFHVLFCPSGQTRYIPAGGMTPTYAWPGGAIRCTVTWEAADGTTSGPYDFDAELHAVTPDGILPTDAGELWGYVYELDMQEIMPPGVGSSGATSAVYSEGCQASVTISLRGGARIIDATLYEYPLRHTQEAAATDPVSVHGAVSGGGPEPEPPLIEMTPRPQIRRRDGWTDERRFGTHQTLATAHQQTEVLGPRIFAWSPWVSNGASFEQNNSLAENNVEPWILTGTTTLTEIISAATSYSSTAAGWVVPASHAQLARYSEPNLVIAGGGRAVVPVRVQVRARWTGTTSGLVRVQSSSTEWIDVVFNSSGTLETREAIGWLESQASADHARAVIQVFGQNVTNTDDLEVYAVAVDWGWNT